MTSGTVRKRRRRADAKENEERVRQSARSVYARRGRLITMDEVATEAGVSKGTVYATFATRQALVDEMAAEILRRAADTFTKALAEPSAWDSLVRSILTPTMGAATSGSIAPSEFESPTVLAAYNEASRALEALLTKGKKEGTIRADITLSQFQTLFRGLYLALPPYSPEHVGEARELGLIILRGIQTEH